MTNDLDIPDFLLIDPEERKRARQEFQQSGLKTIAAVETYRPDRPFSVSERHGYPTHPRDLEALEDLQRQADAKAARQRQEAQAFFDAKKAEAEQEKADRERIAAEVAKTRAKITVAYGRQRRRVK